MKSYGWIVSSFLTGEYDLKVNGVPQVKGQSVAWVNWWNTGVFLNGARTGEWVDRIYSALVEEKR